MRIEIHCHAEDGDGIYGAITSAKTGDDNDVRLAVEHALNERLGFDRDDAQYIEVDDIEVTS